jgi:hypothetical protein
MEPYQRDGRRSGVIISHRHPDGSVCSGVVPFDVPANDWDRRRARPLWTVISDDPLTLDPSILDQSCGLHGYVRDGRWHPV